MPIDPRASVAENNTSVTVGSSSTSVLTANPTRKTVILTNDSDESIYVSLSGTAVMNQGIRLNSSGNLCVNYLSDRDSSFNQWRYYSKS